MKIDWSLIKELLLRIDCLELGHYFSAQALGQHCPHSVRDHLDFMQQAGLIECSLLGAGKCQSEVVAHNLSPQGRELLNTIRESESRQYSLLSSATVFTSRDLRKTA